MMLRKLLIAQGMAFFLLGCAAQPENPWDSVDVPTEAPTRPIVLEGFPLPSESTSQGIWYSLEGANELEAYRLKAEANTAIADAHADQIDALNKAIGSLISAGKAQRRIADMRQEILEEERRHWMFERLGYWVGYILIGASLL